MTPEHLQELSKTVDHLQWLSVTSSDVYGITFIENLQIIGVCFLDKSNTGPGKRYFYEGYDRVLWNHFLEAPSKGKFVWDVLRGALGKRPVDMGSIDNLHVVYNL